MKLTELTNQYRIYVDIDGVLADFEKKMGELMGEPYSQKRYWTDPTYKKQMWKNVADYQKQGGKLWSDLDIMHDADQLWKYIEKYNPEILSASGHDKHGAAPQKQRWIKQHFGPHVRVNIVHSAVDKQRHAGPNHILIDDQEKALEPWRAAGGIGILHTSAANTIKQLQDLGL